jgi:hypothetical protein
MCRNRATVPGALLWLASAALPLSFGCARAPAVLAPVAVTGMPTPEGERRAFDQPDRAARRFVEKRLPAGERELPVERWFAAREQMRTMPQHSLAAGRALPTRAELASSGLSYVADAASLGAWEFMGPSNVGGRVRALLIHPTQPGTLWAAAVGGGVWKTVDGGASWAPLTDLLPNLAVSSLALDPANPNVLYAGTGEGFLNVDAIRGAGIFRSTDGGLSWSQLASTATASFHYVNDLVVSKASGQRLYAATRSGVWRSLDAGATWSRVLSPPAPTGCGELAIATKGADDAVFASCGLGSDQGTVWRHLRAQGAGAWTRVLTEPAMGRISLAIAPSNPAIVYALASSRRTGFHGSFHGVFRSAASGAPGTWVAQARGGTIAQTLLSNPVFSLCTTPQTPRYSQGWYDNVIAVDPKNPNRLWAGGVDLFRSDDAGKTWGVASAWWMESQAPRVYAHADQHAIAFHPGYNGTTNRSLYVGNDGGVFLTTNATAPTGKSVASVCDPRGIGVSWQRRNSLGNTQFYHGAAFPDGSELFGGTQDNGTVYGLAGGPGAWEAVRGGDGGYVAFGSAYLFAENTGISLQRWSSGAGWESATAGIVDTGRFIVPFAVDPLDGERLLLGGTRPWLSEDSGSSWTPLGPVIATTGLSAVALHGGDLLVGTADGHIAGPTAKVQPRQGYVSSLAFDPHQPTVLYATYSTFGGAHVWRSADHGASWQPIDGSGAARLPDVPVHTLVVDPVDRQRLYVGTDVGVFLSLDGGATWAIENTGFPNVQVEALTISSAAPHYLFAFTHGRSAWRVRLPD